MIYPVVFASFSCIFTRNGYNISCTSNVPLQIVSYNWRFQMLQLNVCSVVSVCEREAAMKDGFNVVLMNITGTTNNQIFCNPLFKEPLEEKLKEAASSGLRYISAAPDQHSPPSFFTNADDDRVRKVLNVDEIVDYRLPALA